MLKFGLSLKKISSLFFKYRNDIIVFTEDNIGDKQFYVTLIRRLVEDKIIVNDIIPLGCKNAVIDSCVNDTNKVGKVYIVDGDLDIITNSNPRGISRLYILDSYCIENYLINESAAISLLFYNNVGTEEYIKRKLSFNSWLGYNYSSMIQLFLHLSLAKSLLLPVELQSAHSFLKQHQHQTILDNEKIITRVEELKNIIVQKYSAEGIPLPLDQYNLEIAELRNKWNENYDNYLRIVSGKDYLLPLFQFRLQYCLSNTRSLFPIKALKIFLAAYCDLNRLSSLKDFIYENAS